MRLLVATRNRDKLKELRALLADLDFDVVSSADVPGLMEIEEDQPTVRENAIKKEVDALGGEPGVRSARYAGEDVSYHENNKKLLASLAGIPAEKRTARFRCVVAIADESGLVDTVEGICNGSILLEERGGNGFGYDPLFVPDGQVKTFAELSAEVKNRISHRAKALQKAWAVLARYKRGKGAASV